MFIATRAATSGRTAAALATAATTGVGPLIVHNGDLYAATMHIRLDARHDGRLRSRSRLSYLGGTEWEDCGQPSDNRTLNSMASYKGKLYVGGGPNTLGVFVRDGDSQWKPSNLFPKDGPRDCFPHAMCRHNGKLFVAFPGCVLLRRQ